MNIPNDLMYTESHEWVQEVGEGNVRLGLTDYAQSELGDLVFVNLPVVGDELAVGEVCADVESVKAVGEVYSPVQGAVAAVNEVLLDEPGNINLDCYGAWMIEFENVGARGEMMDAAAYESFVEGLG